MASGLAGNGDFFPSSIALLKTCALFLLLPPFVASAKMMGKDGEQLSRLTVRKKNPYFGGWKKYSSETALWLNTAEFRRSFAFFYHIEIARRMNKNPKSLLLSRTSRNNFKMHAGAAEGEGEAKRTKDVSSQQRRRKDLFRISHPPTSKTKKPRVEERSLCGGEGESPPLQQRRAQKFFFGSG